MPMGNRADRVGVGGSRRGGRHGHRRWSRAGHERRADGPDGIGRIVSARMGPSRQDRAAVRALIGRRSRSGRRPSGGVRMRNYRVALIPGDGIGKDVIDEGVKALNAAAEERRGGFSIEYDEFPWSCAYYLEHGKMMPDDGLKMLEPFDAIYLGAVGFPSLVPDHVSLWGLLLPIRKVLRPVRQLAALPPAAGHPGPAARQGRRRTSTSSVVRENTEGEYAGVGGRVHTGTDARGGDPDDRLHPPRQSSGSCATPSTWPARGATQGHQRHQVERACSTTWSSGTRSSQQVAREYPGDRGGPVPRRRHGGALRAATRSCSTWWSPRTCSPTS